MSRQRIQGIVYLVLLVGLLFAPKVRGTESENKKPLVVVVYADWCPYCQKLKPVLALINQKYEGKIHFVRLDVTSEATTAASQQEARKDGLESFFHQYQDLTSLVVIRDPAGHEVFRAVHDYDFQHYATALDKQLGQQPK